MTNEERIADMKIMVQTEQKLLAEALDAGERVRAHKLVDGLIDLKRAIEDLS